MRTMHFVVKEATVPTLTGTTDVDNLIRHFSLRI